MIEFAPNPSGAAHIGTLRTYAVAWLLSRQRGERLFVRFDAHNLVSCANRDPKWARIFLQELAELDFSPDSWEYLETPGWAPAIPEWADIKHISWSHDSNGVPMSGGPLKHVAYYPCEVPKILLPGIEPNDYHAGEPEIMRPVPDSPCWNYFAVHDGQGWGIDESLVSLQQMHFRGTTIIVRSSLSVFIHDFLEVPAGRYFGYRVPATLRTNVVCDDEGALSKHRLAEGGPGTIRYSLDAIGAAALRERAIASAAQPLGTNSLHWREVAGHD